MKAMLIKFGKEGEYELFDYPSTWGGWRPKDIWEGWVLAKCKNCGTLQGLYFVDVDATAVYDDRQMGPEFQYNGVLVARCENCGKGRDDEEVEFWEYPIYGPRIEDIDLDDFELDLEFIEMFEILFGYVKELDEDALKFIKEGAIRELKIYAVAKEDIQRLKELINTTTSDEKDFQEFFEKNYWMFGLEYVGCKPQYKKGGDIPDFLLERYDGFCDILDLKKPVKNLFKKVGNKLHPRHYLSDAYSQVDIYLEHFNKEQNKKEPKIYRPRGILVIGRKNKDEVLRLRQYCDDHKNVKIYTYDDIIDLSENRLKAIEPL
jgi:hypothetical protein